MDIAPATPDVRSSSHGSTQLGAFWRRFRKRRMGLVGLVGLGLLVLGVLVVPAVSPFDRVSADANFDMWHVPINPNPDMWYAPVATLDPETALTYWLGTDRLGRDVLTRLFLAGRVTLLVALSATLATMLLGVLVGAVAGFYGGWVDTLFMRFTDFMLSWPLLPAFLVALQFMRGMSNFRDLANNPPLTLLIVALSFVLFSWMGVARLVRGHFLTLRSQAFVEATRALGAGNRRIIFKHLLPNSLTPVIVAATLMVGEFIIWEAVLAYFGQGITEPPAPSWGNMLARAQSHIWFSTQANPFEEIRFYLFLFPCLMILVAVLSLYYIADALRGALDPTQH